MSNIQTHTSTFATIAARTIEDMFGTSVQFNHPVAEVKSVQSNRNFMISLFYTGTVYGEYMLAMDEQTAARIVGADPNSVGQDPLQMREDICDAMCETLNTIVGEAIVELQQFHPKLTLTAPRIYFGEVRYPQFRTGKAVLETEFGQIECHFCLDLMRLDLATSFSEAMDTLVKMNSQLKEANRQLAEQQAHLVLTEKMASVGILASGIAHEINNPLFFVDSNLSTLGDYVKVIDTSISMYGKLIDSIARSPEVCPVLIGEWKGHTEEQDLEFVLEDTKQLMRETQDGIERIKTIVQNLKDFSHVDRIGQSEADLNVIVMNTFQLIASNLPKQCRVSKQLAEIPYLLCNAGEIGQALAGIFINAGQAIVDNGEIRISTQLLESHVQITVEDNGNGIRPEDLPLVFDPFFTTKPVGEGTGLGLSIAYGIFEKHGGDIEIESELGVGTRVTMKLPLSHNAVACG